MSNRVLPYTSAICYSGFRDGQSPDHGTFPSYEEIKEDLKLLEPHWKSLRLYDCDQHAETVLEVIRKEGFAFDVMLGAYIIAEVSNPECPWGGVYDEATLIRNKELNRERIQKLIRLANDCPEIISSVSIGNEAGVSWTDHMVPESSLLEYAETVQAGVKQPVTFCENYVPWLGKLKPLGDVLDFISIHTYPVWEFKSLEEALDYTKQNYYRVAEAYPGKQIVITEAGWTTKSNGRGIEPHQVNESIQRAYIKQLMDWTREEEIVTFVFEAFDEGWKGSDHPLEPEKHWGLFYADRTPKPVIASL
jgi:exo-beta-1,3-glucanase (GH17 family)